MDMHHGNTRKLAAVVLAACLTPIFSPARADAQEGTLTFDSARKAMLAANPQAAAAMQNLEAARQDVTAARAGYYPSFSADGSYFREGPQALNAFDEYNYGVSGKQPLYTPSIPAAVRSAEASMRVSEAAYDQAAATLRYQLYSAFADIVNARATIKLSEETLKRRAENVELIRLKYQAGRENKAALLETEAALKTAQWQDEKDKLDLRIMERKLNRLLGLPARTPVPELALPRPPEPPEDFSAFAAQLANHYSLRSARASLAASKAAIDTARSAILPTASASGSYKWFGNDFPTTSNRWSLGASVSLPLFSGGQLTAGLDAAKARSRSSDADLKNVSDAVYLAAEDTFLAWREARAFLDAAKSTLDAGEARAWLVRKQYLAGQSTYFEWRSVEEELISEQNQYLAAEHGLSVSHAAFVQALGE